MGLKKIEMIIPFMGRSLFRIRNLRHVITKIPARVEKITIVQQVHPNEETLADFLFHSNTVPIFVTKVQSSLGQIEKCRLINHGLHLSESEFCWIHDADVLLPFENVIASMKAMEWGANATKPFRYLLKLKEDETELFLRERKLPRERNRKIYGMVFGAASFIIKSKFLMDIGGMNQDYVGWGYEDRELESRVEQLVKIQELPFTAIHLFHPREPTNRENQALFNRTRLSPR